MGLRCRGLRAAGRFSSLKSPVGTVGLYYRDAGFRVMGSKPSPNPASVTQDWASFEGQCALQGQVGARTLDVEISVARCPRP